MYQDLLAELGTILANSGADNGQIRAHLRSLRATHRTRRPASRAEIVRERLIDGVRPVRSVLSALVRLPWAATEQHLTREALRRLEELYTHEQQRLPVGTQIFLGRIWQGVFEGAVMTFYNDAEHRRLAAELRDRTAELSESERRTTEFIATLAHELRNPLAPLRAALALMLKASRNATSVAQLRG